MDIRVVLTTEEGKKEKNIKISSPIFLTSKLMKLAIENSASTVEAFEGNNRIAIFDVGVE